MSFSNLPSAKDITFNNGSAGLEQRMAQLSHLLERRAQLGLNDREVQEIKRLQRISQEKLRIAYLLEDMVFSSAINSLADDRRASTL
jgi:hypothetical protein